MLKSGQPWSFQFLSSSSSTMSSTSIKDQQLKCKIVLSGVGVYIISSGRLDNWKNLRMTRTRAVLYYTSQYFNWWDFAVMTIQNPKMGGIDPNCHHPKLRPSCGGILVDDHSRIKIPKWVGSIPTSLKPSLPLSAISHCSDGKFSFWYRNKDHLNKSWSGFGITTFGIDPTNFELYHLTTIPPGEWEPEWFSASGNCKNEEQRSKVQKLGN